MRLTSPKYPLALLLLLLVLSLALNVRLGLLLRQMYRRQIALRLDPLGLNSYDTGPASRQLNPDSPQVIFFGDSRARDWPVPDGPDGVTFTNRGVDGQTTQQAAAGFDQHVAPLDPDVVVIQVGINDLRVLPLFEGHERDILKSCKQNISRIVDEARALDAVVILTTIFPLARPPLDHRLFWDETVTSAVGEVNDYIRTLEDEDVIVLDAGPILAGEGGQVQPQYFQDYLHLSQAGYERLNRELEKVLRGELALENK